MTDDRPRTTSRDAVASLRRRNIAGGPAISVPPRADTAAPLSRAQQRIWFLDQFAGEPQSGHTEPHLNTHFSKELVGR